MSADRIFRFLSAVMVFACIMGAVAFFVDDTPSRWASLSWPLNCLVWVVIANIRRTP